jgi:hypothetical protein
MEKINLLKQVYSKDQFQNTIDTNFTQLANTLPTAVTASQVTIDQFFQEYQDLFYSIPKFGNTNSHEYLVKTSGAYIGSTANQNDDTINALINEINTLRQENLSLQQAQTQQTIKDVKSTLDTLLNNG